MTFDELDTIRRTVSREWFEGTLTDEWLTALFRSYGIDDVWCHPVLNDWASGIMLLYLQTQGRKQGTYPEAIYACPSWAAQIDLDKANGGIAWPMGLALANGIG